MTPVGHTQPKKKMAGVTTLVKVPVPLLVDGGPFPCPVAAGCGQGWFVQVIGGTRIYLFQFAVGKYRFRQELAWNQHMVGANIEWIDVKGAGGPGALEVCVLQRQRSGVASIAKMSYTDNGSGLMELIHSVVLVPEQEEGIAAVAVGTRCLVVLSMPLVGEWCLKTVHKDTGAVGSVCVSGPCPPTAMASAALVVVNCDDTAAAVVLRPSLLAEGWSHGTMVTRVCLATATLLGTTFVAASRLVHSVDTYVRGAWWQDGAVHVLHVDVPPRDWEGPAGGVHCVAMAADGSETSVRPFVSVRGLSLSTLYHVQGLGLALVCCSQMSMHCLESVRSVLMSRS